MKHINFDEQLMKFLSHEEIFRLMRCTRLMSRKLRSEIFLLLLFEQKYRCVPVIEDPVLRLLYSIVKDEIFNQ